MSEMETKLLRPAKGDFLNFIWGHIDVYFSDVCCKLDLSGWLLV